MEFFSVHARLCSLVIILCLYLDFGSARDTITSSQFIKDPATLSSNGNFFTLGFFSPENSTNRYVGIWYMSESSIVWVANRNQPLNGSSSIVTISDDGNLVVQNEQKQIIWSSNVSDIASNTTCRLLDSGNLVLLDNNGGKIIWQSFEHPSEAYLPSMKISSNKITGTRVKYISWRSPSDPSLGNFYMSLERLDLPELFIWNGTRPHWRSGPWNGRTFTGLLMMNSQYNNGANIVTEMDGTVYYIFNLLNGSDFKGFSVLNSKGNSSYKRWDDAKKIWQETKIVPQSDCDIYGICGPFGSCNSRSSPICNCLRGFEPSSREEWNRQKWDGGCVRRTALQCERVKTGTGDGNKDGFFHLQNIKLPDFGKWSSATEDVCKSQCLENCSCVAYSYDTEIGCISWRGNLTDIQQFSNEGNDLYIRLAYTELGKEGDVNNNKKRVMIVIIVVIALIVTIAIATSTYFLLKWKARRSENTSESILGELSEVRFQELLAYDFEKVAIATNKFHLSNKLGQGGFGPVYKGKLQDGQEIAVKRLSRASGQGVEEFMNEVIVISKLQHCNLVRLLGCCIEGEEKMLIYEYMPNKSLDALIFDPEKHKLLGWRMRLGIIEGVARGLLYLHRDSRLKIIHRDLKASNILLDENLNPKISDFGMARIFGRSEDQANTKRVVGTYGYMSPEYAMEGLFSEKSDVFSFGVLMLEIVAGRRNSSFYNDENSLSLLGFAWKSWNEENLVPLIDPEIFDPYLKEDILRCIHIGLLCVQDLARERPSMSTIISMLNSEIVNLPNPRQPAFIQWQSIFSSMPHGQSHGLFSNNNVSITEINGR